MFEWDHLVQSFRRQQVSYDEQSRLYYKFCVDL